MALASPRASLAFRGHAKPRLAPPTPARSDLALYRTQAREIGVGLMPWQETAARYLEATGPAKRPLYREVAIIVGRQNGKTTLLKPLIVKRLRAGRRIMHTAQDRSLPREMFYEVAETIWDLYPELFPLRNGRPTKPRYSSGQEEIRLKNGGMYSIVAPTRGGARGPSRDTVIIDELREMDDWDFIAGAKPTMTTSRYPQLIYLSNAGTDDSIVLNALRERAGTDPALAYLEWSADPERGYDDRVGWAQANPALGNEAEGMGSVQATLEADYLTASLEKTLSIFDVEHLCRWHQTTRELLVDVDRFAECHVAALDKPVRPVMAVSMDPAGERASASLAWPQADGSMATRLIFDVTGDPIDTDRLGKDLRDAARKLGVVKVGFDPLTDAALAKFFRRTEAIAGAKYANASARFVTLIQAKKLRWDEGAAVGEDLGYTARKPHDESGSFQAVRSDDARPITAALSTIRAVWLASEPRPEPTKPRPAAMGF